MLAYSKESKETSVAEAEWVVGDKFRDNRAPNPVEPLKPLLGLWFYSERNEKPLEGWHLTYV